MRFRNYVNRYNQRNRIFSEDDIWNMRLANIFDNEPAIMAQHKDIGIPSYDELSASDNTEWVEPFINRDGVEDGGYWQSFLPEKKKDGFKTVYIPERPYPVEIDDGVYDPSEEEIPAPNDEEESDEVENTGKNVDNTPTLEGKVEYDIDISDLPDYSKSNTVENKTQTTSGEKSSAPKEEDWKNDPRLGSRLDKYEKLLNLADKVMPVMSNVRYYRASKDFANNKKVNDFERENAVTKFNDVTNEDLKRIYAEKIAESEKKSLDLLETEEQKKEEIKNMNWDIVVPKADSKLYKQIKKSETLQKWVAENYEKIKNNEFADQKTSIDFPWQAGDTLEKLDLYTTVNRADLHNTKINQDGSLTTLLNDIYDFEVMDKRKDKNSGKEARCLYNAIVDLNNAAYKKQQRNEIKKYVLSQPLRYSREELEEILKKYKIR